MKISVKIKPLELEFMPSDLDVTTDEELLAELRKNPEALLENELIVESIEPVK